jgi:hypothetical protein
MSIPGFSAEASLCPRSARYQGCAMLAGLGAGGEVVPSLPVSAMFCDRDFVNPDKYCCEVQLTRNLPGEEDHGVKGRCCSLLSNPGAGISCEWNFFRLGLSEVSSRGV